MKRLLALVALLPAFAHAADESAAQLTNVRVYIIRDDTTATVRTGTLRDDGYFYTTSGDRIIDRQPSLRPIYGRFVVDAADYRYFEKNRPGYLDHFALSPDNYPAEGKDVAIVTVRPSFLWGAQNQPGGDASHGLRRVGSFGYFDEYYLATQGIIRHDDMGYLAILEAERRGGAYLYDLQGSLGWFWTDRETFPYISAFNDNAFFYYFPDTQRPGRYTTNPRYFYNFGTGTIVTR